MLDAASRNYEPLITTGLDYRFHLRLFSVIFFIVVLSVSGLLIGM